MALRKEDLPKFRGQEQKTPSLQLVKTEDLQPTTDLERDLDVLGSVEFPSDLISAATRFDILRALGEDEERLESLCRLFGTPYNKEQPFSPFVEETLTVGLQETPDGSCYLQSWQAGEDPNQQDLFAIPDKKYLCDPNSPETTAKLGFLHFPGIDKLPPYVLDWLLTIKETDPETHAAIIEGLQHGKKLEIHAIKGPRYLTLVLPDGEALEFVAQNQIENKDGYKYISASATQGYERAGANMASFFTMEVDESDDNTIRLKAVPRLDIQTDPANSKDKLASRLRRFLKSLDGIKEQDRLFKEDLIAKELEETVQIKTLQDQEKALQRKLENASQEEINELQDQLRELAETIFQKTSSDSIMNQLNSNCLPCNLASDGQLHANFSSEAQEQKITELAISWLKQQANNIPTELQIRAKKVPVWKAAKGKWGTDTISTTSLYLSPLSFRVAPDSLLHRHLEAFDSSKHHVLRIRKLDEYQQRYQGLTAIYEQQGASVIAQLLLKASGFYKKGFTDLRYLLYVIATSSNKEPYNQAAAQEILSELVAVWSKKEKDILFTAADAENILQDLTTMSDPDYFQVTPADHKRASELNVNHNKQNKRRGPINFHRSGQKTIRGIPRLAPEEIAEEVFTIAPVNTLEALSLEGNRQIAALALWEYVKSNRKAPIVTDMWSQVRVNEDLSISVQGQAIGLSCLLRMINAFFPTFGEAVDFTYQFIGQKISEERELVLLEKYLNPKTVNELAKQENRTPVGRLGEQLVTMVGLQDPLLLLPPNLRKDTVSAKVCAATSSHRKIRENEDGRQVIPDIVIEVTLKTNEILLYPVEVKTSSEVITPGYINTQKLLLKYPQGATLVINCSAQRITPEARQILEDRGFHLLTAEDIQPVLDQFSISRTNTNASFAELGQLYQKLIESPYSFAANQEKLQELIRVMLIIMETRLGTQATLEGMEGFVLSAAPQPAIIKEQPLADVIPHPSSPCISNSVEPIEMSPAVAICSA